MRTDVLTFAGVLAVAFFTVVAAPRAIQANKDARHLQEYLWYFLGLIPIGIVANWTVKN